MKKQLIAISVLAIALFTSCKKNIEDHQATEDLFVTKEAAVTQSGQFVPNELLVKFKSGTNEKSRSQTLSFINGKVAEHILTPAMESVGDNQGVYLVNTTTDVFSAIARMKGESNIEYAEPNWIYHHQATLDDPYYTNGSLWGMYGDGTTPINQNGSQAGEAWAAGKTGSSDVYVGVIDEGAMFNHTDLQANFWTNPFDPVGGGDNDGNGYADDTHGWDFAGNNNTTFDGTADDHGTHVAGTIGAKGGNGVGVAGVNWSVKMISAKFLGSSGGTTANAIKAVDYITDLKNRHKLNIVATNNSWGGGGYSTGLFNAIERANSADILFIAAAGNNGADNDATTRYPSGYTNTNIIAVASITSSGGLSSFSNYGATKVHIGAPGSAITSTLPAASGKGKNNQTIVSGYGSYSGTSMATPHVTGAAALYKSIHTDATAADIKAAIIGSAVPTTSLSGKCVTGGRLNVSGF